MAWILGGEADTDQGGSRYSLANER